MSDEYQVKDLLPIYYSRLFPFEAMYSWLSYGSDEQIGRREFSFEKDGLYSRYNSLSNFDIFKKELIRRCPDKIDIGAFYNVSPAHARSVSNFVPLEKELVFDIDITDYKDVIIQKEEGELITEISWPWMAVAIEVLYTILHEDFGFQHILFVFSGRRGIHAWVCDKRARKLTTSGRSSIAEYIQVISGGSQSDKKVNLKSELHPTLKRIYERILLPRFIDIILNQYEALNDPHHRQNILGLIPDLTLRNNILQDWENETHPKSSKARWDELGTNLARSFNNKTGRSNPLQDIVFTYMYPRLDINVSKQLNHLLKSPLVIHPATGRVCVPIDLENLWDFNPIKVPTIHSLLKDLDKFGMSTNNNQIEKPVKDYTKTRLKEYVEILEKFTKKLLKAEGGDGATRDLNFLADSFIWSYLSFLASVEMTWR